MTLGTFLTALRRRMAWVIVSVVLGTAFMGYTAATTTPSYSASASVLFSLRFGNSAGELAQGLNYAQGQVGSFALLARTPAVLQPVIDQQHLGVSVPTLAGQLSTSVIPQTVIVQVSATDPSPARAATIANAVADQLGATVEGLSPLSSSGKRSVVATTVATAYAPRSPVSPRTVLDLLVGLLGGFIVGAVAALVRDAVDTRVRNAQGVAAVTPLPVLASLDTAPTPDGERSLVVHRAPRSTESEAFRALRTAVGFSRQPGLPLVLLVTSATPAEGKSTVAANLALTFAQAGRRSVLVDADLRRPSIARTFDLEGDAGLTSVLIGDADVADVLQPWGSTGLNILTSGPLPPNPSELIGSPTMVTVIGHLAQEHDVVIIDTAPALAVTDAVVLAPVVSGVVLVGDVSKLRRHQLREVLDLLARSQGRVIGLVLTHVRRRRNDTYTYAYEADQSVGEATMVGAESGPVDGRQSRIQGAVAARGTTVP